MLKQPRWLYWLFIIGVATFTVRALLDSDFRGSGLLYLGVPFLVAVLVHHFLPRFSEEKESRRALNHLRNATVVMLATSAILFEGFLCVLMFLPIYWLVVGIMIAVMLWSERATGPAKLGVQALPLLLMLLALEGTTPALSFDRDQTVTRSQVVNADVAAIKANLARPLAFEGDRNWFISLFPLPDRVQTGTLRQGDVHRLHFTYRRWFFANLSKGEMHVRLSEVSDQKIRTQIVRNDSYLSHYLRIDGTEVLMQPVSAGKTRVILSVRYTRLLDPYWYFGPMQHYAVGKSADYLLANVIDPAGGGV
jgi:hypothetical protein